MTSRPLPTSEIPTSPMADIAFLLVIYFMITLTFSAAKGLDYAVPPEEKGVEIEREAAVLVEVRPSGKLVVDGRDMPLGDLLGYLAPKLERNPTKPVILKPDPQARYGAMVAVYDELRQGRTKLGLSEEIRIALPTAREMGDFW